MTRVIGTRRLREKEIEVTISLPRVRFLETPPDRWAALDREIAARLARVRNERTSDAD